MIICYINNVPSVLLVNGYRFFFFSNEGYPLEPCHIHVRKHGALAKYWIGGRVELAENDGFSAKELKEIGIIIHDNEKILMEAWNGFFVR